MGRPGAKIWGSWERGVRGNRRGQVENNAWVRWVHVPAPTSLSSPRCQVPRAGSITQRCQNVGSPKEIKGRTQGRVGTHCARSGHARSQPRRRHGCAGSSWRGRGGRRCTGAVGGWAHPSRSARAVPRPRRLGGARLRPGRGRLGPGRGLPRTGSARSAWQLPRAPHAVLAARVREAGKLQDCACRGRVRPSSQRCALGTCALSTPAPTALRLAATGLI